MTETFFIAATLLAAMSFCALALYQDGRQRRIDRQLAVALSSDDTAGVARRVTEPVLVTRPQADRLAWLLRILLNYSREIPLPWRPTYTVAIGVVVVAITVVLGNLLYPFWMVVPAAVFDGCLIIRLIFGWQRQRYALQVLKQLPDAIEIMISCVRAGLPVSEAFNIVSNEMREPTQSEFRIVASEIALGKAADEAIRSIYERTRVTEYAILSVTLAVQGKSGGRLAQTLDVLGDSIRQRIALAGRARALAGEAKLSGRVLAALPLLACGALYLERPAALTALYHDPRGQTLLAIAIVTLSLGILTMRRMIQKGTSI